MHLDGFHTVASLADDLDLRHHLKKSDKALSYDVMVLDNQSADSICHSFIPFHSQEVGAALQSYHFAENSLRSIFHQFDRIVRAFPEVRSVPSQADLDRPLEIQLRCRRPLM